MKISILKKLTIASCILVFIGLFVSCNNEEDEQALGIVDVDDIFMSTFNLEKISLTEKNELIEIYAYLIARSLELSEFRNAIKEEAKLKFDGDYDILTRKLESFELQGKELPVKELLKSKFDFGDNPQLEDNSFKNSGISGSTFIDVINLAFPNLQIAVPIHCEKWDVDNYIPVVAFIPIDFNEREDDFVNAFNVYGERLKISTREEPQEPVIVVGISERVNCNGDRLYLESEAFSNIKDNSFQINSTESAPNAPTNLTLMHGSSKSIILQWTDVDNETSYQVYRMHQPPESQFWLFATTGQNENNFINSWISEGVKVSYKVRAINAEGNSAYSPIATTHVSARNDGEQLKVKRIKFTTAALKAVESWISGAPEIRLRVVKGSSSGVASEVYVSGIVEPPRRGDVENQWWDCNIWIANWYTGSYGTVLTFDWREEDPWDKVTFGISGSWEDKYDWGTIKGGGNIQFTDDKGGGHMGLNNVFYWDLEDYIYNLTGFEYQFEY